MVLLKITELIQQPPHDSTTISDVYPMNPFPKEWELLSLFESEPTIIDRGVPWEYNCLIFETSRGGDRIRCEIEPGYEAIKLQWRQDKNEVLTLDLHWVRGLRVVTGSGRDYLVATFRDSYLLDLEFHLKPMIFCTMASPPVTKPEGPGRRILDSA